MMEAVRMIMDGWEMTPIGTIPRARISLGMRSRMPRTNLALRCGLLLVTFRPGGRPPLRQSEPMNMGLVTAAKMMGNYFLYLPL